MKEKVFRNLSKSLAVLLLALIIVVSPFIRQRTLMEKSAVNAAVGDLEARNMNAFAQILGEIRATAADLMFIKTERYFHGGVAYKPHMDMDKMATTGEHAAKEPESHADHDHHDDEHGVPVPDGEDALEQPGELIEAGGHHHHDDHDHSNTHAGGVPTLIRTASQDFRGFLGNLERETKPFQDPRLEHHVTTGDELLPWYRLMTLSDPQNLRGYMIGTMLLMQAKKPNEALAFIQEGIEKNRDNRRAFRLYASLAQVRYRSGRLDDALAAARKGYDMGKAVRPKEGEIGTIRNGVLWTDDLENDFLFVARYVPLFLERKGEPAQALRAAQEVTSLAPDDEATKHTIERLREKLQSRSQ